MPRKGQELDLQTDYEPLLRVLADPKSRWTDALRAVLDMIDNREQQVGPRVHEAAVAANPRRAKIGPADSTVESAQEVAQSDHMAAIEQIARQLRVGRSLRAPERDWSRPVPRADVVEAVRPHDPGLPENSGKAFSRATVERGVDVIAVSRSSVMVDLQALGWAYPQLSEGEIEKLRTKRV